MASVTMPELNRDEWLKPGEAAAIMKLTVRTLSDMRWKGTGPVFAKLSPGKGGRVRYRRGDVEDWLARGVAEVDR